MQSRLASLFFAFFAFGLFAYASPVASKDVAVARAAGTLDAILNIFLDLQAKINVHIAALAKLSVNADISVVVAAIIVEIKACITALVSVGAVVDLSDKDKITVIANVCAQILISIFASVTVYAKILVNITAVVSLDLALQGLLVQLNLCISGILVIIAPLTFKTPLRTQNRVDNVLYSAETSSCKNLPWQAALRVGLPVAICRSLESPIGDVPRALRAAGYLGAQLELKERLS
ncbi:hypothetical protein AURDEDRAFT_127799 [Auricularia subglabra TFB-10046 SS5]|nr:hypothetical protein AURDEDRAFT_127799 [Auricularia subglabra TFB-10046 SS5]